MNYISDLRLFGDEKSDENRIFYYTITFINVTVYMSYALSI